MCRPVARERALAERPDAAAEVAQHVVGTAGLDLDARRVAAKRSGDLGSESVDVCVELVSDANARPEAPRSAAVTFARTSAR